MRHPVLLPVYKYMNKFDHKYMNKYVIRGINLRKIAEQMGGSSGAEVKGTCTEAGQS